MITCKDYQHENIRGGAHAAIIGVAIEVAGAVALILSALGLAFLAIHVV